VAISRVIVSYKLDIEQVTLCSQFCSRKMGGDSVCVIICTDYFRMSIEKTLM